MAHGLLIIATLLALLALPCVLALVIFVDVAFDWCERVLSLAADWWRGHRAARRLERHVGGDPGPRRRLLRWHADPVGKPAGPPF